MSVSYWCDQSHSEQIDCDICLIGGGLAGLSTCFWLVKNRPELKVVVIEKGDLGAGASGRNAGFITCGSVEHFNRLVAHHGRDKALQIWKFSEENLDLLKTHILSDSSSQERAQFSQSGSFSLASTTEELNELGQSAQVMREMGLEVESIDRAQLQNRLDVKGLVGGVKYLNDASVHPIKLLNLIWDKTKKGHDSPRLLTHNEVFALEMAGSQRVVKTNRAQITCSMVVLATNAYTSVLEKSFTHKIHPTRGQILVTEPIPKLKIEAPCYCNFVLDYFRQLPDHRLLIGGFRQIQKDVEVGLSDITTEVIQQALQNFIAKHIPLAKGAVITHRWAGIMGFTNDGQPLLGFLPTDPQVAVIAGFTAHGLGQTFHAGKVMAEAIMGGNIPEVFSLKRFDSSQG